MAPSRAEDQMDGESARPVDEERRRRPRLPPDEPFPPAQPTLEPLYFSTRDLATDTQFAAWQAHVAPLVDVSLPHGISVDEGFSADHTAWNLGSMLFVQQHAPAHSYVRSASKLRSNPIDHWVVVLPRTGQAWTEVNEGVAESQPGKVEFRSLGHPFRGRATESKSVILYIPRDLFTDAAATLDAKNNSVLLGNFANLVIDYVNGIEARLRTLTADDIPSVIQATRDMILAGLFPSARRGVEQQLNIALMERARRYVQRNLNSPALTPDALCRELGVSRTRLYRLFEPSGGVLHYIQKRRLLSTHAALSDPANRQRIIDIAESAGFSSAANFSRAFSSEFGYSPREARNVATPARLGHAVSSLEQQDKNRSFEEWLRMLGS
jgi:AraC-like DNA-binding protein